MTREERKEYMKAWHEAHKESEKAYQKAYRLVHKEKAKAYYKVHKEERKEYQKAYQKAYHKTDVNSFGQTKESIRRKSRQILKKSGIKIPGYEIHHCFTYDDPSKFIYISKSLHLKIHQFLRDNNINADSNHYEQIKALLDANVIIIGL